MYNGVLNTLKDHDQLIADQAAADAAAAAALSDDEGDSSDDDAAILGTTGRVAAAPGARGSSASLQQEDRKPAARETKPAAGADESKPPASTCGGGSADDVRLSEAGLPPALRNREIHPALGGIDEDDPSMSIAAFRPPKLGQPPPKTAAPTTAEVEADTEHFSGKFLIGLRIPKHEEQQFKPWPSIRGSSASPGP